MKRYSKAFPLVFLTFILVSCLDNSMKFHQKVESPDGDMQKNS